MQRSVKKIESHHLLENDNTNSRYKAVLAHEMLDELKLDK